MDGWKPAYDDDQNLTDEQRLEAKLNEACEKVAEALAGLLVQLVNLGDAARLETMQQATGHLFKLASEDFGKGPTVDTHDN